jgi:hypothetical protein
LEICRELEFQDLVVLSDKQFGGNRQTQLPHGLSIEALLPTLARVFLTLPWEKSYLLLG